MNNKITVDSQENYNVWSNAEKAISHSRLWQFLLITIGSASSIIYPHVPLVGFAAISGVTLNRKQAIISSIIIWLVNQFYGFTLRQYPQTLESFTWGIVMGLGTLLVTILASIKPKFIEQKIWRYYLWLSASLVIGYVLFEGIILLTTTLMVGDGHGLTVAILGRIFVKNIVWAIALTFLHSLLIWNGIKFFKRGERSSIAPT
ncbi:MAG: hypothetical protein F6K25_21055 [Okeania sp. SIO2G4]|uniref:hypothetical protein n=1 Tax=unclassified Okeania TaxID=2634635 RepID=UPI0013B72FF7|nr:MULTISPECIES: hypothetical protein [unclassified Okeania]NEP74364.1 hypothetical protein [Okeania sp. SIO2G5]NEP95329.1 hypothetical protein [Okeania sp. SIO2F5]NEQ93019.1 hypothetical protein [Okeania sp. SIO2G4]